MKKITTYPIHVCVKCGQPVKDVIVGALGTQKHTGHKDSHLDTDCGTWGFKTIRVTIPEDDDE